MSNIMMIAVVILAVVVLFVLGAIWDKHLEKQWENLKGTLFSRTYWHDIKEEQ